MAIDSLAYILNSLALLRDAYHVEGARLVEMFRPFLEAQIMRLFRTAVDPATGLPRRDTYFSSMKDHAKRSAACYDVCMLYMIQRSARSLKLAHPLAQYNYRKILLKHYWTGAYFRDDLSGKEYVAGDAQVFPFWCGLVHDKRMLKLCIDAIRSNGLDMPVPLRYTDGKSFVKFNVARFLAPGYEGVTSWLHMGLLYVALVGRIDVKLQQMYIRAYTQMIETYGTFPEVLNSDGTPYRTPLYYCDEGMSWCANYLALVQSRSVMK